MLSMKNLSGYLVSVIVVVLYVLKYYITWKSHFVGICDAACNAAW